MLLRAPVQVDIFENYLNKECFFIKQTELFSLLDTSGWRHTIFNWWCLFIFQHVATTGVYFSGLEENQPPHPHPSPPVCCDWRLQDVPQLALHTQRASGHVVNFQLSGSFREDGRPPLTCAAGAGGPLGGGGRAQVPVQGGVGRRQHPAVTQGGGGGGQGLAAQRPPRLVHGSGVADRHCHVHGEALLRQRRRLQGGDRQRGRSKPKNQTGHWSVSRHHYERATVSPRRLC